MVGTKTDKQRQVLREDVEKWMQEEEKNVHTGDDSVPLWEFVGLEECCLREPDFRSDEIFSNLLQQMNCPEPNPQWRCNIL